MNWLLISEDVVKYAATLRRIRWPRIGANFELAVLFLCRLKVGVVGGD